MWVHLKYILNFIFEKLEMGQKHGANGAKYEFF